MAACLRCLGCRWPGDAGLHPVGGAVARASAQRSTIGQLMRGIEGLNPDFEDMLVALVDAGADFLVVGAYALGFHGIPRATGDIDIFVRPSEANAHRVFEALVRFGAPVDAAGLTPADLATPGTVYQIGVPPRRIDIITRISGVSFDEAWPGRATANLGSREVSFLGREALMRNKAAAGRDKDRVDLRELKRLGEEDGPPKPR